MFSLAVSHNTILVKQPVIATFFQGQYFHIFESNLKQKHIFLAKAKPTSAVCKSMQHTHGRVTLTASGKQVNTNSV